MQSIFPEKVYEVLAWINRVFLPAATVLVAAILGFCKVDPATIATVEGLLIAITAFLGKLLQDDKKKYEEAQRGDKAS